MRFLDQIYQRENIEINFYEKKDIFIIISSCIKLISTCKNCEDDNKHAETLT